MRGILFVLLWAVVLLGIIPAHAGNTIWKGWYFKIIEDHPRSCGEYFPGKTKSATINRIIPAHAGNTLCSECGDKWKEDHPRSCGEYQQLFPRSVYLPGSSPLMRGIQIQPNCLARYLRIIPAHAGNTFYKQQRFPFAQDHPRSCGEYLLLT